MFQDAKYQNDKVILNAKIFLSSYGDATTNDTGSFIEKKEPKSNKEKSGVECWRIDRDARLVVESNFHGAKVIRAYGKSTFGNEYNDHIHCNLCGEPTLSEFKKGEIKIYVRGNLMTERDLHYRL